MKYTTIIFDMDGTIIETDHIWKQATRELITRRGIHLSDEKFAKLNYELHGLALHKSCQLIKNVCNLPDNVEILIQEKGSRAYELYAHNIRFIKGFLEFYKKLQSQGIKSAIATNATQDIVDIADKKLSLKKLFSNHVYHMNHVNHQGKPNPAVFLHAAQQLKSDPQQCIVIEDSSPGIQGAKNAGMYCIAINTSGKKEKLQEADLVIESYHDLNLANLF